MLKKSGFKKKYRPCACGHVISKCECYASIAIEIEDKKEREQTCVRASTRGMEEATETRERRSKVNLIWYSSIVKKYKRGEEVLAYQRVELLEWHARNDDSARDTIRDT